MRNEISKWSYASHVFSHEFKVIVADTSELRDIVYRIRHHVYCQELGFEPVTSPSHTVEIDEFDPLSIHCLVQHRKSEEYIGCVRVVISTQYPSQQCQLPFKNYFGEDSELVTKLQQQHRGQPMIEISRLAIKPEFRKHLICENSSSNIVQFQPEQKKWMDNQKLKISTPLVSKSLYFVCALIADALQIDGGYAMMEKRLVRHLKLCGIHFTQISEFIEHKGSRALFSVETCSIFDNIPLEGYPFIQTLREDLKPYLLNRFRALGLRCHHLETDSPMENIKMSLSA